MSLATSTSGEVTSWQEFKPWGELRVGLGDIPETTLDFTGQRRDGTGLLYYNARYYDPAAGQFISPDVLVPVAANVSGYGMTRPLNHGNRHPTLHARSSKSYHVTSIRLRAEGMASFRAGRAPARPR